MTLVVLPPPRVRGPLHYDLTDPDVQLVCIPCRELFEAGTVRTDPARGVAVAVGRCPACAAPLVGELAFDEQRSAIVDALRRGWVDLDGRADICHVIRGRLQDAPPLTRKAR